MHRQAARARPGLQDLPDPQELLDPQDLSEPQDLRDLQDLTDPQDLPDRLDLKVPPGPTGATGSTGPQVTRATPGRPDLPAKFHLVELGLYAVGAWLLVRAFGVTGANAAFGAVRNPYKPECSAGGSSGGAAVAIVEGMAYGSVGTDREFPEARPASCPRYRAGLGLRG